MPARTGRDRIGEALAEQAARAGAGRKWLFLRDDGEQATIRFLSDVDDASGPGGQAVVAKFHQERRQGGGLGDPVMCTEDDSCPLCTATGEPSRLFGLFWVYVYDILHAENREQSRFGGEPWEPVNAQGRTLYRERVEGTRVFQVGSRLLKQVMTILGHEGTLLTKDYTLSRSGRRGSTDTTYLLYPLKESAFTREVPSLVSLLDYSEGRVTLTGEEARSSGTPARRAIPESELEEFDPPGNDAEEDGIEIGYDEP